MEITLNGETRQFDGPISIDGLIDVLGFAPEKIAIERNLEIVPRSEFATTMLSPGDKIEIVQFVGGG